MVELLASADSDPYALSADERARVLAYSRAEAELTRAAVTQEWERARELGGGVVSNAAAAEYEVALRAHGEHLGRAMAMNAIDRIHAAGADEESLSAAGAFGGDDWDERQRLVEEARAVHERAWKEAMAEEMSHRKFGNVQPNAEFTTGMTAARRAAFAEAAAFYPDGMITQADDSGYPMRVRLSAARAHYSALQHFPTRKTVPVYTDAHDVLSTLKHKVPSETVEDAVKRALSWAGSSFSINGPSTTDGVPATPENRAMLDQVMSVWRDSDAVRKRYGAKPEVVEIGDRLYLRGGKTKSLKTGAVSAAELTTNGSTATTVHELAHRMEASNRQIGAACHAFHARRTAGLEPTLYAKSGKKVEMATEDSFVDHYVGKLYADSQNHTEVFSMGMESIAAGEFGGLTGHRRTITMSGMQKWSGRTDREHHALIMGLLSTASADRD